MCACIVADAVNQWLVVVDRVHELILRAVLLLWRCQELCWRILELHSFKLVSTGIIWVCVQEVRLKPVYILHKTYVRLAGHAVNFNLHLYAVTHTLTCYVYFRYR